MIQPNSPNPSPEFSITDDPIVDEVRAVRRKIADRFDHDLDKWFAHLQAEQARGGRKIIPAPPRKIAPPQPPASAE